MLSKASNSCYVFYCLCLILLALLQCLDGKPAGDLIIIGHGGGGGGGGGHHHHHSHPQFIPIPIPIPMGGHNYHSTKIIPIHIPSYGKPFHQHITIKGPKGYANAYTHHTNHHHQHDEHEEYGHDEYGHGGGHGDMYKDDGLYNDDFAGFGGYY